MQKNKLSGTNFLLCLVSVLLALGLFNSYSNNKELKKKLHKEKVKLAQEKEVSVIYDLTQVFLEKSSFAKQGELLTGEAKKQYDAARDEDVHEDEGTELVEEVKADHVFAVKTSGNKAKSYAIYKVVYKNGNSLVDKNSPDSRIVYFTLNADWKKVKDTYKVNHYEINLLKDSMDQYLSE
ncbi:hypothetical protein [Gottfriedia solisilvae]|uniref:hypothetical protein n=1 Tax=Gottfriedia solisilvae TaxID=1516104 RepID=UPI003D2F198E